MTKIEWTHRKNTKGESWNFIAGCTKVSPACDHCYALRDSWRIMHNPKRPDRYDGVAQMGDNGPEWTGVVNWDMETIRKPYGWEKPRTVFVNSMADLFHASVPYDVINYAWYVMARNPQHTFLVLTKRSGRLMRFLTEHASNGRPGAFVYNGRSVSYGGSPVPWPLPNVWVGVTAESQEMAQIRVPHLLKCPAVVHWVSVEPMLGEMSIFAYLNPRWLTDNYLRWVVVGGESGKSARPMHPDWARYLRDDCVKASTSYFLKQWGEWACPDPGIDTGAQEIRRGDMIMGHAGGRVYPGVPGIVDLEDSEVVMRRVGRKAAGRLLDGREWNQWPEV